MPVSEIQSIALPTAIPPPEALRGLKESPEAYTPWFWEAEYKLDRYLARIDITVLKSRHAELVFCLSHLAQSLRADWPRIDYRSAWFWFRKEHQTRFEIYLRSKVPPVAPALPPSPPSPYSVCSTGDPVRLFRYLDAGKYADDFLHQGIIRVARESSYQDGSLEPARQDDECSKTVFLPGGRIRARDSAGNTLKLKGDVRVDHSGSRYHMLCTSTDWDPLLFSEFNATHCVVIHDVEAFTERLERAGTKALPRSNFHHDRTSYFDPYEQHPKYYFDHAMRKNLSYAWQREYRFIWSWDGIEQPAREVFLELGPLTNIAEIISAP